MSKKIKVETLQEYLSRGGTIKKLMPKEELPQKELTRQTSSGPAQILSLDEAELFYGEGKVRAKKVVKAKPTIDLSLLPENLRKVFMDNVAIEDDGGEDDVGDEE